MEHGYLMKEYELCFGQLQYYDTRQTDFVKYYYALSSAVITAQFALLKFQECITNAFYYSLAALSLVGFAAGVLFYAAMLRNRVYFVLVARQINAIRGFLMTKESEFKSNQLYTRIDLHAFRTRSLQTIEIIAVTIVSSLFAGMGFFGIAKRLSISSPVSLSVVVFLLVGIIQVISGVMYLIAMDKKSANESLG